MDASTIAAMVAAYLDDRDDISSAGSTVEGGHDTADQIDHAHIAVVTQGGERFVLTVVAFTA